jgi:SAM-dependent methyltransferase
MLFDLQMRTIYRDMRDILQGLRGNVLDVGCGPSPYRFLLDEKTTRYVGIDIEQANVSDSSDPEFVLYDGSNFPFLESSFDAVICTEVLEHVFTFQNLVDEVYRVMKDGGTAAITVPWSARYHLVPRDFFRYTPSTLRTMFARFSHVEIRTRGTDISVIGAKLVVVWFRNLTPSARWKWALIPLWVLSSPLLGFALIVAHLCTVMNVGSTEDPLGYTIVAKR